MNAATDPVATIDAPAVRCLMLACTRFMHADEIHIDGVDESLRRKARGQRADTGVGDDDVELPELGDPAIDRRRECGAVADVGDLGVDTPAFLLHESRGLVEVLRSGERVLVGRDVLADVDGDDVGAFRGEQLRMRPALTPGGSADQRYLALDPAHRRPPCRLSPHEPVRNPSSHLANRYTT